MLQSTDRGKIYFYFLLLLFLLTTHNVNLKKSVDNFFEIKDIHINSDIDEKLAKDISSSLAEFYYSNIFSVNMIEIKKKINDFNFIHDFKIKKRYPSSIYIDIKKTNIIAYYFENNVKTYLGENGKKIKKNFIINNNLPLIVGEVEIKKFLKLKSRLNNFGFKLNDFSKFYFFKSNRWDLVFKGKILIKLPIDDIDHSLNTFKKLIENSDLEKINIIDLRLNQKIILS